MKTKFYLVILPALFLLNFPLSAQNTFPSSGSAGIGTATPNASALLEIKSSTKGILIPRMTQAQRNAIKSPATSLLIYVTDVNPGYYYYSGSSWTNLVSKKGWQVAGNSGLDSTANFIGTTDKVPFLIRTNNTERMRIASNGNVGIGVTSPAALLHINGGGNASLTNNGYVLLGKTNNNNLVIDNYQIQARSNGTYNDLFLNAYGGSVVVGNTSTSYDGILAEGSANGVDGESPNGTGVYGNGSTYGVQGNATNSSTGIGVYGSGAYGLYGNSTNYNDAGVYGTGHTGVEAFDSTNGYAVFANDYGDATKNWGNGIGVYAKSYAGDGVEGVSVHGNAVHGYSGESGYAGYFDGNVYASGTYTSSDATLKQNITDMQNAMTIINQLKPKYYNFRNDGDYKLMKLPQGKHYGLIAQDVEKVLPGLIKDTKFDAAKTKRLLQMSNIKDSSKQTNTTSETEVISFKALNYTELIPIMIKGMQEQQQMITSRDSAIDDLQNQINELKAMIVSSANSNQSTFISSASLAQNIPNPFSSATTIGYKLPSTYSSASIIVTDAKGVVLKQITLNSKGKGNVQLDASTLAAGAYRYALYVDGKMVDSKQMVSSN